MAQKTKDNGKGTTDTLAGHGPTAAQQAQARLVFHGGLLRASIATREGNNPLSILTVDWSVEEGWLFAEEGSGKKTAPVLLGVFPTWQGAVRAALDQIGKPAPAPAAGPTANGKKPEPTPATERRATKK
jgi:hypothetical protein